MQNSLLGETMKKRFALIACGVFGLSVVLSGCNLFVNDKAAYYNQAVATVTYTAENNTMDNITITKEDLMQGYNRYGETLSNNGYSGEKLMEYLTNLLIDQKIVLNEVTRLINENKITVTNNDNNAGNGGSMTYNWNGSTNTDSGNINTSGGVGSSTLRDTTRKRVQATNADTLKEAIERMVEEEGDYILNILMKYVR